MSDKSIVENARKTSGRNDFLDISAIFGRPPALRILPHVYHTRVTPIHLTILAFIAGIFAALLIAGGSRIELILGAILIQIKNVLDTLDGHLARARNRPSRAGSLLDSNTDFLTNLFITIAVGYHISEQFTVPSLMALLFLALLSSLLQCSYFVFYLRSYLSITGIPGGDDPDKRVKFDRSPSTDQNSDMTSVLFLEKFYSVVYGWQDRLMQQIDAISLRITGIPSSPDWRLAWYGNKQLLKLASILGLGSQLFLVSMMTLIDRLDIYIFIPILIGNGWLLSVIVCRIFDFRGQSPS
jgi:phosphatidylglycerophosphate synthase